MKKVLGSLLVLAGMAMTANAQVSQRTQYEIELSTDGTTWTNDLSINPSVNSRVFARVHISYVANGGPTPLFFNGGRMQPLAAGWNQAGGDAVVPFNATTRVTATFGATPTLGRVFGATTVGAIIAHQYAFGGTNYLRFAEAAAVNHPGQGTTNNNVNGASGINTSNNTLGPTLGISELPLFVWGMDFSASRTGSLSFTIPQEGFRTSGATANPPSTRSATWVTSSSPFVTVEAPTLDTLGATLTFVPAPGAAALLGLGGLIIGRRRR
jgi:hypothetical protein